MWYQGYPEGLYVVRRWSAKKGLFHYAVLDIGNRRNQPFVGWNPVIFHMASPELRSQWLADLTGSWQVLERISDEGGALRRIAIAAANPKYDLFGNNCEHFATFVSHGKRESRQLQVVAGLAIGVVLLLGFGN